MEDVPALAGCIRMFMIMPTAIILLIMELSPALKKGNGSPVFGSILVATPILKNI